MALALEQVLLFPLGMRSPYFQLLVASFSVAIIGCGGGGGSGSGRSTNPPPGTPVTPDVRALKVSHVPLLEEHGTAVMPTHVSTGYRAGGHAMSWDGRIFVGRKGSAGATGWYINVFRPEVMQELTPKGQAPVFLNKAAGKFSFSPNFPLELKGQEPSMIPEPGTESDPNGEHNSLALVPLPEKWMKTTSENPGKANPFRSDKDGNPKKGGAYKTYEILVIAPRNQKYGNDRFPMGRRFFRAIVKNPETKDATIEKTEFFNPTPSSDFTGFEPLVTVDGQRIIGIEPTVTLDGRLLIWQGHFKNNGLLGFLKYSYNPEPGALTGWSTPRNLSAMYYVDRNTMVAGIPFKERYPLAKNPFSQADGHVYPRDGRMQGAYPWVTRDGTDVTFSAAMGGRRNVPGEFSQRSGLTIMGQATNWARRQIDGPLNPDRHANNERDSVRIIFSSPGIIPSVWRPYGDQRPLRIPYTSRRRTLPLFGAHLANYGEVDLEDFLDGNYIGVYHMNEVIRDNIDNQTFLTNVTPDTSGYLATGTLRNSAAMTMEATGQDRNSSGMGRAMYFKQESYVEAPGSHNGFKSLANELSVELHIHPLADINSDARIYLVNKPGSFSLRLDNGKLVATVETSWGQFTSGAVDAKLTRGQWTHLAFTFGATKDNSKLITYINGVEANLRADQSSNVKQSNEKLIIGPNNPELGVAPGQFIFMLDEVKISKVVRTPEEIQDSAYIVNGSQFAEKYFTELPPGHTLPFELPSFLTFADLRIPRSNPITAEGASLGRELFTTTLLSSSGNNSCSSCHDVDNFHRESRTQSTTDLGELTKRAAPAAVNRGTSISQGWGKDSPSLEAQAEKAHKDDLLKLASDLDKVADHILAHPTLPGRFRAVYGVNVDKSNLLKLVYDSIGDYLRVVFTEETAVDRYNKAKGLTTELTDDQIAGQAIFNGKGRCIGCHSLPNFTDELCHNTCLTLETDDKGCGKGAFKTPSLRIGLASKVRFLHDDSVSSLREVVELYNKGGLRNENTQESSCSNVSTEMRPLELSNIEMNQLVEYLKAL